MTSERTNLFLVEDHPIMREALAFLVGLEPDFLLCGVAASAEEALDRLPADADVVLVDVSLPGMNGLDLVREVRARWPELPCLVLSGHAAERYAEPAARAGAVGYVMKDDAAGMAAAVRRALVTPAGDGNSRG